MMYLSILFYNIWYQGQKVIKMYVYIHFYDFGTCKIWECSHFSKKNERNSNVFRIARERSTKQSVGIIVDNTKVKRSKNAWYQGQKVKKCMFTYIFMTLGPAKHENVAIFRRKMSGIRMFLGLRESEARRNP